MVNLPKLTQLGSCRERPYPRSGSKAHSLLTSYSSSAVGRTCILGMCEGSLYVSPWPGQVSECVYTGFSGRDWHWTWGTQYSKWLSLMCEGIHWGSEENKQRQESNIFSLLLTVWTETPSVLLPLDWNVHHWFLGLRTQTGIYPSGFPGFPVCEWRILGPLSLHNSVRQFLLKKSHFTYTHMYIISISICVYRDRDR